MMDEDCTAAGVCHVRDAVRICELLTCQFPPALSHDNLRLRLYDLKSVSQQPVLHPLTSQGIPVTIL